MAGTLREFMSEHRKEKAARDARFEETLENALRAGGAAAGGFRADPAVPRVRGLAWVRVADGRSAFARFTGERHADSWLRGDRVLGVHLPAPFDYLDTGLAWAQAVADVLNAGDARVTVGHRAVTEAAGGGRDET